MGTLFFLSHQSGDSLHLPSFPGADKLAHMIAYAGLASSVIWFFAERAVENHRRTVVITVLFCILYGISDEFHQSFIPLRSVSVWDLVADAMGAVLFCTVWLCSPALQQRIIWCQQELTTLMTR
jgi:VanZ family protein